QVLPQWGQERRWRRHREGKRREWHRALLECPRITRRLRWWLRPLPDRLVRPGNPRLARGGPHGHRIRLRRLRRRDGRLTGLTKKEEKLQHHGTSCTRHHGGNNDRPPRGGLRVFLRQPRRRTCGRRSTTEDRLHHHSPGSLGHDAEGRGPRRSPEAD